MHVRMYACAHVQARTLVVVGNFVAAKGAHANNVWHARTRTHTRTHAHPPAHTRTHMYSMVCHAMHVRMPQHIGKVIAAE